MAREINLLCDFIFGSIHPSLPTDTVDVELTIRTVKGIYTYRKDHMAKSTVFSPWSRTMIPFPSPHRKKQAFQSKSRQAMAWGNNNATPYFPPLLSLDITPGSMPQVTPGLGGLTKGIGSML